MKSNLKNQLLELLSGNPEKPDIIIFDTFDCELGFYRYNGRIINEQEKEKLQEGCNRSVTFVAVKDKTTDKENSNKNHLTVTIDNPETANTFIKLRGIKK